MDFQSLNRRELQALCKLNNIPANITNLAMIDALTSLGSSVVGMENILKPSETTDSSVESPTKTEMLSPRVPRTSYRTSTRRKPAKEESETVQTVTRTRTVTRTTRRGVSRQIAGEVEDAKTDTLTESKEDEKVEESMNEKIYVPVTPAAAVPSSRRKGPTASTTRRVNVEENVYARTYSTRRSTRLTEVKAADPSPVKNENKKLEKMSSTQSFEEMLDEGSDGSNAISEVSSLSGCGVNELTVGSESTHELLEPEKETTSRVDTDMGIEENAMDVDAKNDVLESIESNNMEIRVILSDIQNPSEVIKETGTSDDIAPEIEDSKLEIVEKLSSYDDMESIDLTAAEMENEVLDNKSFATFKDEESEAKNSSETLQQQENVSAFENNTTNPVESLVDDMECQDLETIESIVSKSSEPDVENQTIEVVAVPTKVPLTKTPSKSQRTGLVSNDKENIDMSGIMLQQLRGDVGMKTENNDDQSKALHETSLRQLTKMLKNKLQISKSVNSNAEEANVTTKALKTTRPALQMLSSNSLAATEMGN